MYCQHCQDHVLNLSKFDVQAKAPLDRLRCLGDYSGALKQILIKIKFDDRKDCADFLANRIKPLLQDMFEEIDMVIPVPSHSSRFTMRGFYVVDQVFKSCLKSQEDTYLYRKYPSLPSYLLSKKARELQLRYAFKCHASPKLRGARVMLLDDIVSSQSTLIACARCLKAVGAKRVEAIGLAYKQTKP